jgi:hypothetical protein
MRCTEHSPPDGRKKETGKHKSFVVIFIKKEPEKIKSIYIFSSKEKKMFLFF